MQPRVPAAHAVPARKKGRQLAALLGGTSKPEESFDETLDRVIEEQPVFEAVMTPLKPHVGHAPHGKTGGKPGKRAAKPKPAHLEQPRKPTAKRTAKAAAKTARPARKR